MNRFDTYTLIARCLALDFRSDYKKELIDTLKSDALNWNRFFKTGSNHLVLQTLYRIFNTHNILSFLPQEVNEELERIYTLNMERNRIILNHTLEINSILKSNNIDPVFLKGASHLINKIYTDAGDRIMADIDFMVAENEILPAVEALKRNGYIAPISLSPELSHIYKKHHPRLHKPGLPAYIEIHWEAVRPEYRKNFSYKELYAKKIASKTFPECYTLAFEDSAIHNFIHSQLEHKGHAFARVYLRNMYDLLLLSQHCNLQETFNNFGLYPKKSASYIYLTDSIFQIPLASQKQIKASSKLFIFRHKLNVKYITLSFVLQLLSRFYVSYIKKAFLFLSDRSIRKLTIRNLSSKSWYRQHFGSYKSIFGKRKNQT